MTLPVTLFTGQWADLTLEEVAKYASEWGYDGLEIACSGEHLDVWRAAEDDDYLQSRLDILDRHGLKVWALSNHLTGQAVCDDPIDFRHKAILRSKVWRDGEAEGVRQRAAEELKLTAKVANRLGVDTITGFTGSKIWQYVAMFPPVGADVIDAGYEDFATRWNPILDVFDGEGVRYAHEVHPGEIAYDYWTCVRALEAVGHRTAFGFNWDPSHRELTPWASSSTSQTGYITSIAKTPASAPHPARPACSVPIYPGATPAAVGTSFPPATVTCRGKTLSGRSDLSATQGPFPWSGKTPEWAACTVPKKQRAL
jgi:sugar phosphate isomerase/epimerase